MNRSFRGLSIAFLLLACAPAVGQGTTTISSLPAATTPLGGTELVPVVQGGVTKKAPASAFGGSGNVTGPVSSTSGNLPSFNGTTGQAIQDSGVAASAVVTQTGTQTLTNKTLTAPVMTAPALGTPASATLTNATGLPPSTGLAATGTPSSSTCVYGDNSWKTCGAGGSGSVTNVATGACLTGGPITTTGTISATSVLDAQTGTSYTVPSSDACAIATSNNSSAVAWTLPQATGSFAAGWSFDVWNKGAGLLTITPTTSTIDGATTLTVPQSTGCSITSDGTNYQVSGCTAKAAVRNDVAFNFSGVPGNSQKFTFLPDRPFSLPASLTGSRFAIGTNPTSTLTVTLYKNGSSIGTVAFSTGGTPTVTFALPVSFTPSDTLTAICPGTADATGADIAGTLKGTLN